jgi:serine/threonine protein kinase/Tfp pilus assembly protein PilF
MSISAPTLAAECIPRNRSAQQFVSSFLRGISPNERFDTRAVLADHPEVAETKAAVLDLALEDFCRREAAGEKIAPTEFAQQFNRHAASVLHLLQFRQFLEANGAELSASAASWPQVGEEFLGFLLCEELGRGACARVYLAMQPSIGDRLVVLKVTPNSTSEVQTLGRLSHPHVAEIHSVQTDDERGLAGICMPYLGRATLNDALVTVQTAGVPARAHAVVASISAINAEIPVSAPTRPSHTGLRYVDFVIDLGRQIASALEYTHGEGICHFDIKPTNVLIASDLTARLIDFNLAATTSQQSLGGTVPYMSPEQLRRHLNLHTNHLEGPASDIYSLGVLLFEMLTGKHPFRSFQRNEHRWQAAEELLRLQLAGSPSMRALNPLVDRRLESAVATCLAPNPSKRPDAASLRAQLERELSGWGNLSRWTLAHRRSLRWSTAAAGILGAGLTSYLVLRDPPAVRAYDRAVQLEERGELARAESYYDAGLAADPTQAPLWFGRGKCRLAQNRFEEACQDFLQARETGGGPAAPAYAAYCMCLMQRDWKGAIALFQETESQGAQSAALWNDLAYCYLQIGDYGKADEYVQRCISASPKCGESRYILARVKFASAASAAEQVNRIQLIRIARRAVNDALRLGYQTADVYFDAARFESMIAALSPESTHPASIQQIKESLGSANSLGLDPNRIRELERLWPELKGQLVLAQTSRTNVQYRPPVVEPHFSPAASASLISATR